MSIHESKVKMIDMEVRNSFQHGTTLSILKSVVKFNYHGMRNKMINQGLTSSKYPRYFMNEDWLHIVQYKVINNRCDFIRGIHKKLTKASSNGWNADGILAILNDIMQVLKGKTNFQITQ